VGRLYCHWGSRGDSGEVAFAWAEGALHVPSTANRWGFQSCRYNSDIEAGVGLGDIGAKESKGFWVVRTVD